MNVTINKQVSNRLYYILLPLLLIVSALYCNGNTNKEVIQDSCAERKLRHSILFPFVRSIKAAKLCVNSLYIKTFQQRNTWHSIVDWTNKLLLVKFRVLAGVNPVIFFFYEADNNEKLRCANKAQTALTGNPPELWGHWTVHYKHAFWKQYYHKKQKNLFYFIMLPVNEYTSLFATKQLPTPTSR